MNYRATILIVEDDINLLQGIRDILELQGYAVLTASHGLEGLELMRHSEAVPDLIISDIMMPQMDGYEFFKEIRKDERWIIRSFSSRKGEKTCMTGKLLGPKIT
jgi:CheY-like chemotaxis protein